MIIGRAPKRPNIETVRRLKHALREALDLPDEAMITLSELACLEEDCAPVETVFGLLRPDAVQLQYRVHKPVDAIDVEDLRQVCRAWGVEVEHASFASIHRET